MRKSALALVWSLATASALLLAACGGGSGGGTAGNSGGTGTSAKTATGGGTPTGNATTCKPGSAVKVDGTFTMVCLKYNEVVFGVAGQTCPTTTGPSGTGPCFDQGGNSLDPTDPVWPKPNTEATASAVKFWFPPTGSNKKFVDSAINVGPEVGKPVTVPVPAGTYSKLELLAGAGNSNSSQMLDIEFDTSSGKASTQQNIDDWCNTSPVGAPGYTPQGRWSSSGSPTTPGCGVFVYTIPITAKGTLKDIVFSFDANDASNFEPNILAVTLQK